MALSVLAIFFAAFSVTANAKKSTLPTCAEINLGKNNGCSTGGCAQSGLHPTVKWNIPFGVPLLEGYGNGDFKLSGNIPDDTDVTGKSTIKVTQINSFKKCCHKCKTSSYKCKYFQFLNLGTYGGLCFIYSTTTPHCNASMLVKTQVGAKCQGKIVNDPHLTGAYGTKFDFSGVPGKTYCLVSDKELNINMKMTGYLDSRNESATVKKEGKTVRSWVREMGINWKSDAWNSHTLRLVARSGSKVERADGYMAFMEYNGDEILPRMSVGQVLKREGGLKVSLVAIEKDGPFEVDFYRVEIQGLVDMDIRLRVAHPLLRTPQDAMAHISMGINRIETSPMVHGVLGQTYRSGREKRAADFQELTAHLHRAVGADSEEGKGFLDGSPEDYITSSILAPDCKYSAYQGWASEIVKYA